MFAEVKVHRDFHVEVGRSLYSAPKEYLGQHLDARADTAAGEAVSPRAAGQGPPAAEPGRRVTDPADLPERQDHLRDARHRLPGRDGPRARRARSASMPGGCWTATCRGRRCGRSTGCSGWSAATGPARSTRPAGRALDLDVVNVTKIASMLEKATENTPLPPPPGGGCRRPVRPRPRRVPAGPADPDRRRGGGQPMTATIREPSARTCARP